MIFANEFPIIVVEAFVVAFLARMLKSHDAELVPVFDCVHSTRMLQSYVVRDENIGIFWDVATPVLFVVSLTVDELVVVPLRVKTFTERLPELPEPPEPPVMVMSMALVAVLFVAVAPVRKFSMLCDPMVDPLILTVIGQVAGEPWM
jgi:hypothetical protein